MRAVVLSFAFLLILPAAVQPSIGAGADASYMNLAVQPPAERAYADVGDIVFLVNETLVEENIGALQSFNTRYCLAANNRQVAEYVAERMGGGGASVSLEPFQQSIYTLYNAVATIPGTGPHADEIVVACAHMDSITGLSNRTVWAPGADDNGSGTAAVMLMAEILAQYQWNRTIRLCAFNAEELGLTGSEDFTADSKARGDDIVGAFNLDMIAYNGADANLDLVYTNGTYFPGVDSEWMADGIIESVAEHGLALTPVKYCLGPTAANSDHYPFWQNGFGSVCVIEKKSPDYPYYHTIHDTIDKLNLTYATDVTRAVLGAVCDAAGINSTGDIRAPGHSFETPSDGSYSPASLTISVDVTDACGLNEASIELRVDGLPVVHSLQDVMFGSRVTYSALLAEETEHTARIRACDDSGNWLDWNWSFITDSLPPAAPTGLAADTVGGAVNLTWMASASPDFKEYRLFKASTPSGFNWASPYKTLQATSYNDISAAATLGASFYSVKAVDFAGNMDEGSEVVGKVTSTVYNGWTLLGNPLGLADSNLSAAFDYLSTYWTEALAYSSEESEWKTFSKAIPEWANTLDSVDAGVGFWIKVGAVGQKLCLCGGPVMNGTIPLSKGWNLVAYPFYSAMTVSTALAGIPYDMVEKYDYFSEPYKTATMAGTEYMAVGGAYWIHVAEDCGWSFAN